VRRMLLRLRQRGDPNARTRAHSSDAKGAPRVFRRRPPCYAVNLSVQHRFRSQLNPFL
jgi:hypothetical protein